MEWERGRRLLPRCLAPLPKLLPHRGDESGLECPAVGALESFGIHSPPGQVGVGWSGLARPSGDRGERQVQTGAVQPAGAGKGWGSPQGTSALVSGPSTRGEDGEVLGRPNKWSHGTCPGRTGALEELSQSKAAVPDVAASGGQLGSSAGSLRREGKLRAWRPYTRAP